MKLQITYDDGMAFVTNIDDASLQRLGGDVAGDTALGKAVRCIGAALMVNVQQIAGAEAEIEAAVAAILALVPKANAHFQAQVEAARQTSGYQPPA